MSYSFGLFFKQCKSFEDGFQTALKTSKLLAENKVEYIKENKYSCPSIRYIKENKLADGYWLYALFDMKFVYFKKHNILALSGFSYPKEVKDLFDGHVHFQNSTDQDYEAKEWPGGITLFNGLKGNHKFDTYEGRSDMYDDVYKTLHLDDYINRKENESFTVFHIQAMTDEYMHAEANTVLRQLVKEYNEE